MYKRDQWVDKALLDQAEPISEEQTKSCIRQWQDYGDTEALWRVVKANLRLVISRITHSGVGESRRLSPGDFFTEGVLALVKAAGRFEASRGFKFSTFAISHIDGGIKELLAHQNYEIRINHYYYALKKKLALAVETYYREHGQPPTLEELAEAVRVTVWALTKLSLVRGIVPMEYAKETLSSFDEEWLLPNHGISPEGGAEKKALREYLGELLDKLDPREAQVIAWRFSGEKPLSLKQTGKKMNLSRESVRQIQNKALDKMRAIAAGDKGKPLRDFLEL